MRPYEVQNDLVGFTLWVTVKTFSRLNCQKCPLIHSSNFGFDMAIHRSSRTSAYERALQVQLFKMCC